MNDEPELPLAPGGDLVLYRTEDGRARVSVRFDDRTVWLTQADIAELFQTTPQNITMHLAAICEEGEFGEAATCKDYLQVRREGERQVRRNLKHYNLEAILAVGYRVRSARGTQFRQWATAHLEEYLVKGFVLDDERLKNPPGAGVPDYFDELLERIRDIRASERRMYLRVRDQVIVNETLQAGLAAAAERPKPRRYRVRAVSLGGVRRGVDLDKTLSVADMIEDEELLHEMER